jgi:hypothetical protein
MLGSKLNIVCFLNIRSFIFLLFFFTQTWGNTQEESHIKYCKKIDHLYSTSQLVEKEYPNMHYCGGSLRGFYDDSVLVFMRTVYSGEMGFTDTKWYVKNDSLVYTHSLESHYVDPKNWDEFCARNKDRDGNCDLTKLKKRTSHISVSFKDEKHFKVLTDGKEIKYDLNRQHEIIEEMKTCFLSLSESLKEEF